MTDTNDVIARLAAPFDTSELKWKPAAVSGNRALALCYVDARVIMDRLDEVLGPTGWTEDYEVLPDGNVICRLKLKIGEEWIQKVDVGGPSEQPDGGDRMKAGFSDALKRAAVKFGIGRFLYRLPSQWVDYDPHKKQFVKPPVLHLPGVKAARQADKPSGDRDRGLAILKQATDLASLGLAWKSMSDAMRRECAADKDNLKALFKAKEDADAAASQSA